MFVRVLLVAALITLLGWSLLTRASNGAGRAQSYVVQPGDTLWSIATSRYGDDPRAGVWRLQERNRLAGTTITPGEKLIVP